MTEVVARKPAGTAFQPSFYFWMTLLMAFFVFGGFGMTYLAPLASGTFPPAPPVVHFHGIFYFGWMVLLVTQSLLVNVKNVRMHRSLGTFGIALATGLVFFGALITILGAANGWTGPNSPGLFYLSLVAPPSFAVLFTMAIRAVRTPAQHRNLILLASLSVLMPGINRLYMMGLGLTDVPFYPTYLTMDAMIAAIFIHDWRKDGTIGRPTMIGAAIVVGSQLLFPLVVRWQGFEDFTGLVGSIAYYR